MCDLPYLWTSLLWNTQRQGVSLASYFSNMIEPLRDGLRSICDVQNTPGWVICKKETFVFPVILEGGKFGRKMLAGSIIL